MRYFLMRGNAANAPLEKDDVRAAAENWSNDVFQVSGPRPDARKKILETLAANPQNLHVPGQFEIRPSPPTVTRLSDVEAPTIALVGEGDIADVHAFAGAIQAAGPVARREVWKGVGHLIELEEPDQVAARIEAFIAVAERAIANVPVTTLRRFAGTYSLGTSPATVAVQNRRLVLQLNGDADVPLFAETEAHFFVRTTGTDVQFERDHAGKVTAMVIKNPNGPAVRCPRTG